MTRKRMANVTEEQCCACADKHQEREDALLEALQWAMQEGRRSEEFGHERAGLAWLKPTPEYLNACRLAGLEP